LHQERENVFVVRYSSSHLAEMIEGGSFITVEVLLFFIKIFPGVFPAEIRLVLRQFKRLFSKFRIADPVILDID